MKKTMENFYYTLTKTAETSLLGLLAGMVSGIAINIATSQNISFNGLLAILLLIMAVVGFIWLNNIRQDIDQDFTARDDLKGDNKARWKAAADYDNTKRVRSFFSALLAAFICTLAGISLIYASNKEEVVQQQAEATDQAARLVRLQADSATLHAHKQVSDSLLRAMADYMLEKKKDTSNRAGRLIKKRLQKPGNH